MRLSGWYRIGVVLSLLWCIAGGLWIRGLVIDDMGAAATSELSQCLSARSIQPDGTTPAETDWGPCNKAFYVHWARDVNEKWIETLALYWGFHVGPNVGRLDHCIWLGCDWSLDRRRICVEELIAACAILAASPPTKPRTSASFE